MPQHKGAIPPNKIVWTDDMISFLKENFHRMTNPELAAALGLRLTSVRTKCYQIGLKHQEMEYWTKAQVRFLVNNYKKYGDTELAEIFSAKWHKNKGWSKKHIEKKRRYLGLKRTAAETDAINRRNVALGKFAICVKKRWEKTGQAPEGEIRYWKNNNGGDFPVIKINGKWLHWNRYTWEQHHGSIQKGFNVVFKDGNNRNLHICNLELISNAELGIRNVAKASKGLSDNYVAGMLTNGKPELRQAIKEFPELIELKRQSLTIKRQLYGTKQ